METAGCSQRVSPTLRLVDPLADKDDWAPEDFYPREPHAAIVLASEPEPTWYGIKRGLLWLAFGVFVVTGIVLGLIALSGVIV